MGRWRSCSLAATVCLPLLTATSAHASRMDPVASDQRALLSSTISSGRIVAPATTGHQAVLRVAQAAPAPLATGVAPAPPREPSWPRTLSDTTAAGNPEADRWSPAEVAGEQKRCGDLLAGLAVVAIPIEPFRDGVCGSAAPVQLISVGRNPEVSLYPPAILSCDMVAALHAWAANDLQPLARKHLGAPVIRIEVMSAYSCRNAYGRRGARLSEHGKANALDVAGFFTADGLQTAVLDHWGPTAREIEATRIAAEKAAATAKTAAAQQPAAASGAAPAPPSVAAAQTLAPPAASIAPAALGFAPPSRLGGPGQPPRKQTKPRSVTPEDRALFLRGAHRTACAVFGTALGPEANRAHENHLHIDMAQRRSGSFCE